MSQKQCRRCGESKPEEEYGKHRATCRTCRSEQNREYKRRTRYGLSPEEYTGIRSGQYGNCAICFRSADLVVDHCHSSLEVRGLLCGKCNTAIAYLQDNPAVILNAARYVADRQSRNNQR
jgi:hypothetical protein